MIETIRDELEIELPRINIIRLRKSAMNDVYDTLKDHYSRVWDFGHQILLKNPKNTVKISSTRHIENDENKFKRIYVCYHALKEGWKAGCRPILGLDGCFLKTVCGGQLLSAIGRDGNNNMFPVAYAVVEGENAESWRWFVQLLQADLCLGNGYGYTIISHQQKGLEKIIKELLPHVDHRFCAENLYNNFRKKYPSKLLKREFWNSGMLVLKKLDPKCWIKAYFGTTCQADNVENNMSKCFNAWIINERYLPLLNMLQEIHFKIMNRMRDKRDGMKNSELQVCPRIKKKLDKNVTNSRSVKKEFWEFNDTEPLLPPDIPKKLRGRPKKLRRREEWEGGRPSQSSTFQVLELVRFNVRRKMHCSICMQEGHRKPKCPNKPPEQGNEGIGDSNQGDETNERANANERANINERHCK